MENLTSNLFEHIQYDYTTTTVLLIIYKFEMMVGVHLQRWSTTKAD